MTGVMMVTFIWGMACGAGVVLAALWCDRKLRQRRTVKFLAGLHEDERRKQLHAQHAREIDRFIDRVFATWKDDISEDDDTPPTMVH